jgi:hypothetical protein
LSIVVERFLAILSGLLIGGCLICGWFALRSLAEADDLKGLFLCSAGLVSGLSAQRMLGGGEEDE